MMKECGNCGKEYSSDQWNGYCSKICWWGFTNKISCES